jgi:hypothetical protein
MPSVIAEVPSTEKPTERLHSEAVSCTLPVGRQLKTEMSGNSPRPDGYLCLNTRQSLAGPSRGFFARQRLQWFAPVYDEGAAAQEGR